MCFHTAAEFEEQREIGGYIVKGRQSRQDNQKDNIYDLHIKLLSALKEEQKEGQDLELAETRKLDTELLALIKSINVHTCKQSRPEKEGEVKKVAKEERHLEMKIPIMSTRLHIIL